MDLRTGHLNFNPQEGPQKDFMQEVQESELTRKQLRERFVAEDDTPAGRKLKAGRNDPCPCGSGLKLKKCCGPARPVECELCGVPHHPDGTCFPTPKLVGVLRAELADARMKRIGCCGVLAESRVYLARKDIVEAVDAALDDLAADNPHIEIKRILDSAQIIIHKEG